MLYIKNMVSQRCIIAVKAELKRIKLKYVWVELGTAKLLDGISQADYILIQASLGKLGLELIKDRKKILIEKIKKIIHESVNSADEPLAINFSDFLSQQLSLDYTYLANIFSHVEHNTIEKFIISSKIDRVKIMIEFDDMNLTQISYVMHYSSVAHLSNQFKKVTGITPSNYKQLKEHRYP